MIGRKCIFDPIAVMFFQFSSTIFVEIEYAGLSKFTGINYIQQINICDSPCIYKWNKSEITLNKPLGDSVEMLCDIGGVHKTSQLVMWEKNGEPIFINKVPFHKNYRYILRQVDNGHSRVSSTFIINNLQKSDKGSYSCKISASDEELNFQLCVYEPDPEIFYSPYKKVRITAPGYVEENQTFNISCSIDINLSESKLVTVDWYQNGIYLSTSKVSGRILIKQIISLSNHNDGDAEKFRSEYNVIRSVAILVFESPKPEINGIYECRAYKPISQIQYIPIDSAALKIRVLSKHQYHEGNISQLYKFPSNIGMPSSKENRLMKQGNHQLQNDDLGKKENFIPVNLPTSKNTGWQIDKHLTFQSLIIFAFIFHLYYNNYDWNY